jgi:adenylate cyclase
MRSKTFSFKVLLLISMITCLVAICSAMSVYLVARHEQMESIRNKLVSTATTAARFIDPLEFSEVIQAKDTSSLAWKHIAAQLRTFQNNDPDIRFIYAVAPTTETANKGIVQFIVDPVLPNDENHNNILDPEELPAACGELYNAKGIPELLLGLKRPSIDISYTTDKWGQFMSGYAPILDAKGNSLGAIGVDITFIQLRKLRDAFIIQFILVIIAVIFTSILISWILSRHISRPVRILHEGIERVGKGDLETQISIPTGDEFERLANRFNAMVAGLRERKRILGALERYMSKEVAELVMQQEDQLSQMRRRRVTVLFCDIEKLTSFAENASPEKTAFLLSTFHEHMIDAVFRNGGIVDKLLGDGLMALFGTPLPLENQEESAVRCAIEMQAGMAKIREITGVHNLEMGVGIHAGIVVAGNIGSERIMDYTVIGDAVNVASRLEGLSRSYPSRILTSQAVTDSLQDIFEFVSIGPVELKNRKEPLFAYQVIGLKNT